MLNNLYLNKLCATYNLLAMQLRSELMQVRTFAHKSLPLQNFPLMGHNAVQQLPGSFEAPMKPSNCEAASKPPMPTNKRLSGASSIFCVTSPDLHSQGVLAVARLDIFVNTGTDFVIHGLLHACTEHTPCQQRQK